MLNYNFIEVDIWRRMGQLQMLYSVLRILDLNFQSKTFQVAILRKVYAGRCKHYHCHQTGSQVLRDLDQNVQSQTFS